MNIRKKIRQLLKEESPIVLTVENGKSELQQMPYEKWSALDSSKKEKIRTIVGKRNGRVLDKIESEDDLTSVLSQVETHVKSPKKAAEAKPEEEKKDDDAKPEEEEAKPEEEEAEEKKDDAAKPDEEEAEENKEDDAKPDEEEAKPDEEEAEEKKDDDAKPDEDDAKPDEDDAKPDEEEAEEKKDDAAKPDEEEAEEKQEDEKKDEEAEEKEDDDAKPEEEEDEISRDPKDKQSDLDLTPNFVNVFFTYVNSLMDKPVEAPKVESKPDEESTPQTTPSVEATPDYSDPTVFSANDTSTTILPPLLPGWEEHISQSSDPGKTYYFNPETGETVWERPSAEKKDDDAKPEQEEAGADPPLPEGWTKHVSQNSDPGSVYYTNEKTGETQWTHPGKKEEESAPASVGEGGLAAGWTEHVSESSDPGKTYYFNESTGETVWEKPVSTSSSPQSSSPGEETERAVKPVVEGKCYKCGNTQNLNLKTYKIEQDKAVPVHFCSFKCFESIEF